MNGDGQWAPSRVRGLLDLEGLTPAQFAAAHGVDPSTIYKWLRGQGPGAESIRWLDMLEEKLKREQKRKKRKKD
jgi:transcriptional regulator with XRE-family HTH domain